MADTKQEATAPGESRIPDDLTELYDRKNGYGIAQYKGGDWPEGWSHNQLAQLIERIARLEAKTEPNQTELRANVNQDASGIWKRRAWDMKRKLDALQGGSTEWIDVMERRKVIARLEGSR